MKGNIVERSNAESRAVRPSAPRVPNAHLFDASGRPMLLAVEQGRIYGIDPTLAETLDRTMAYGDTERAGLFMAMAGLAEGPTIIEQPPISVPVRSL